VPGCVESLAIQGARAGVVLCTTAVEWTTLKLIASVITTAAAPHETTFKPLFNIAFMVVLPFPFVGDLHHAFRRRHGVIYNYITR
jgi:hypothetical protein